MMFEVIDEPVNVEGRLRQDGTVLPLRFDWRNRQYHIESWGRESLTTSQDCTVRCFMVQTLGLETWELCYSKEKAQWKIARHWAKRDRV